MSTTSLHLPGHTGGEMKLRQIHALRYVLPLSLFSLATAFEIWEHWFKHRSLTIDPLGGLEVIIFGVIGPLAVYITLTYVEGLLTTLQNAHTLIAGLNRDLEFKVAERTSELQQANLRLREIDQMKSDFVSLVSHELRTPLATLNGGLEAALQYEEALPARAKRILYLLLRETACLTSFVQTILDVSQLEVGRLRLNCGPVAVKPLLKHAVDLVFGGEEARIVWRIPHSAPPVWADEVYTEQAIRNLLVNAQKYTPPQSPIIVEVWVDDPFLCICVTDFGPGISPDLQERVFERFARLPQANGERPSGWGLGLHFARALLAAQGGSLTLQSPVHAPPDAPGSRFTARLPIAEDPVAQVEEELAEDTAQEGEVNIPGGLRG